MLRRASLLALAACASPPPAAPTSTTSARTTSAPPVAEAPTVDATPRWSTTTQSPWTSDADDDLSRACGTADAGIAKVATRVAKARARGTTLAPDDVTPMLREAGVPHVRPRIFAIFHPAGEPNDPLRDRLAAVKTKDTRCGIGRAEATAGEAVVAITVEGLADLAPLVTRARSGQWITLEATPRTRIDAPKVFLVGAHGAPRTIGTWADHGVIRARFAIEAPGAFTVQLVGDVGQGPRPILEASLFADVEPGAMTEEPLVADDGDPEAALLARIAELRNDENVRPLHRDSRLDAIARDHATAMRAKKLVAHDVGDGDLRERFERAHFAKAIGENVARAASVAAIHQALDKSPSHRANLLGREFTHVGVGIAASPDGTLYACEVFAADLH